MEKRISLPLLSPTPGRRPVERADAARNRAKILAAARRLLAEKPIDGICMEALAREAGVGKATLFRRFEDRSSLCFALLDEDERALQEQVLQDFGLPHGASPWHRLRTLLDALLVFQAEHVALLAEAEAYRPGAAKFASAPYVWRRREIARRIQAAERAGVVRTGDRETTVDLIVAGLGTDVLGAELARGATLRDLRARWRTVWRRLLGVRRPPATRV